jgi:hypothetical protein
MLAQTAQDRIGENATGSGGELRTEDTLMPLAAKLSTRPLQIGDSPSSLDGLRSFDLRVAERQPVPALERICVCGSLESRLVLGVVARDRNWMTLKPDDPSAGRPRLYVHARHGAPDRVIPRF